VLLLVPLLLLSLSGCGEATPDGERDAQAPARTQYESSRWGYTVSYPVAWIRAPRPLTPPRMKPREILSVATIPLRFRRTNCDAWAGSAQQDIGDRDVFVSVREAGDLSGADYGDFGARPSHVSAQSDEPPEPSPCPGGHGLLQQVRFSDAGRNFDILLGFGSDVSDETRREAYRIVDSLRFDPDKKPGWAASPS
jgi:hypothetical protein